jgi:hypothetical protein
VGAAHPDPNNIASESAPRKTGDTSSIASVILRVNQLRHNLPQVAEERDVLSPVGTIVRVGQPQHMSKDVREFLSS